MQFLRAGSRRSAGCSGWWDAMANGTFPARRLFALLLCLGLAGCLVRDGVAVHVSGPQLDAEAVAWMVRGETPEAEILAKFGAPTFVVPTSRGKMLVYREVWQRTSTAGILFTTETITSFDEFLFVEITGGVAQTWTLAR